MADERPSGVSPRLIVGVFLMTLGVLFTLGNLKIIEARQYLKYWPVVLIAIALQKLTERGHRGRAFGSFMLILGCWLLASNLRLIPISFWQLWPGILFLLAGAALALGALFPRHRAEGQLAGSQDSVRMLAVMGSNQMVNDSQSFRGGEAVAVMGGCELDLRRAATGGGEAVIEAFAFMGGIEIKVPEGWSVVCKGLPLMGGFEDSAKSPGASATGRLVVKGMAIMGGVEVHN